VVSLVNVPRIIDYNIVEKLATIQCTDYEIAYAIGYSKRGFTKRKKNDEELVLALEKGRSGGQISLRRAQFAAAIEGRNPAMLIWLGKQMLHQSDHAAEKQADQGQGSALREAMVELTKLSWPTVDGVEVDDDDV